jgi:CubicO group peptidase (beta-lactamase class C family)
MPQALEIPSVFQPGEGWRYGGGLDWTGLLISRLTGITLGAFMRKEIFDVLGCDANIGFSRAEIEKSGTVVQCATVNKTGGLVGHHNPDQQSERGGGGLFASAANYIKILADLIAPEPKVLRRETVELLFTPQLSGNKKALKDLSDSSRIFGAMAGPLTESLSPSGMDHALGGMLVMEDSEALGKTSGTMTWGGAFSSMWFANREQEIAAFYGSSMFPPAQGVTREVMAEFVREVWSKV